MQRVLVTGGSGFFGELLKHALLDEGLECVNVDLKTDTTSHPGLTSHVADILESAALETIFSQQPIDCVFHCAAVLSHAARHRDFLWNCNVEGTRNVAGCAAKFQVPKVVFVSTNCLWAESFAKPVTEEEPPRPGEIYGESKLAAENVLQEFSDRFDSVIIRTPTIIGPGRLGLLTILFEFIDEGRRVWVVGGGKNRIQFIDADDLAQACIKGMRYEGSGIFNVGSNDVKSLAEVYEYVIGQAGTRARVAVLPRGVTLNLMKLAYFLRLSPLGPYQYKAIAESFQFDTSKAHRELGWKPTATNEQALFKAYEYYHKNLAEIRQRKDVSAHKQPAKLGLIRLLKWLS